MWQHCAQTRMAVTFRDVRADPDMGKRKGVQRRRYCGWLYHSLSGVNVRATINSLVEQFFFDDVAVTLNGNCDSLPRSLRSSHRFGSRLFCRRSRRTCSLHIQGRSQVEAATSLSVPVIRPTEKRANKLI